MESAKTAKTNPVHLELLKKSFFGHPKLARTIKTVSSETFIGPLGF